VAAPSPPVESAFLLIPGRSRAAAAIARLDVPPQAEILRLELMAPPGIEPPGDCIVTIRTNNADLLSEKTSASGRSWIVRAPARLFSAGDYEIAVRRVTAGEPAPDLAQYSFRLIRK